MSIREWGLFNDEGCVEAQFWSQKEARDRLNEYLELEDEDSELRISEVCTEHDGQELDNCEECLEEEEDDEH